MPVPPRASLSRVAVAAALSLTVTLAGCGGPGDQGGPEPPAVPDGSSTHTITVDGRERTFRVYRPRSAPEPAPLVVMLHGAFGSGRQAEAEYGWNELADAEGFLVAYPDGLHRAWAVGDGCCGRPGRGGVDDVAFVTELVAAVDRSVDVDAGRTYATGISNGGMLAYRLACDTTLFAGIGPVSATLLGACGDPAPVSVIHIHGTADRTIRYDGEPGRVIAGTTVDGPPVPELVDSWRATGHCGTPSEETMDTVTVGHSGCPEGGAVELITIEGAGHQWPGSDGAPAAERLLDLDPPATELDATATLWEFFAAHPAAPAGAP